MHGGSKASSSQAGFSLVELVVAGAVLMFMAVGLLSLFSGLVSSANLTKRRAVALTLATNQMEYIKTLSFDRLAVSGGAIVSATPIPATTTQTLDRVVYTVTTSINYIDDAFDGCGSYPTAALKATYCRNQPEPSGSPSPDTNPQDYKIAHVHVSTPNKANLADIDTQISARVSETSSTTGALFVNIIDDTGNPVSGATIRVTNITSTPLVDVSDNSDSGGTAIFYGLPPDTTNYDYNIVASKAGYTTLTTIVPSGALQPNFPNKQIFTQLSSVATLVLKQKATNSLWVESVGTSGSAISGLKINLKGGYKKYNSIADTAYYYDSMSPADTRQTTDATGNTTYTDLVPGDYIFCGDNYATSCTVGASNYYLLAAVPYGGTNSFMPITVPSLNTSIVQPTFSYSGSAYYQKTRLILSTDSLFPRVYTLSPSTASLANATIANYAFTVTGANLPCAAVAASCVTVVTFTEGAIVKTASCTGAASGVQLSCTVDLSTMSAGIASMTVVANSRTLSLPGAPLLGGFSVAP
jgi:type II secretory pathway pseudopilin PulG